jgi:hypothetical protein
MDASKGNPDRPRLPHEYEAMLAGLDARCAVEYSRLEVLGEQLEQLADLFGDRVGVVAGTMRDDASAVINLRKAKDVTRKPSE